MEKEIEEAAGKYINDDLDLYESLVDGHISYNIGIDLLNKLFTAGAKWQAERMHSEEDMIEFAKWVFLEVGSNTGKDRTNKELFNEWFEQFKKK